MNIEKNRIDNNLNSELLPNWHIFIYLAIINFLIAFLASEFIFTREFYHTIFSDQLELTRIDKYVDIVKRFSFWSLLLLPLFLLIKYLFVALILQIPLLIRYIEISFKYIFRWVMFATISLTAGQIIYFIRLYFTAAENISASRFKIQPLSLAAMINPEEYTSTSITVLNQFNLFDILWGTIIYIGLLKSGKIKKIDAFFLVLCVWTFLLTVHWAVLFFLEKIK